MGPGIYSQFTTNGSIENNFERAGFSPENPI
jgi:hypothetical protein